MIRRAWVLAAICPLLWQAPASGKAEEPAMRALKALGQDKVAELPRTIADIKRLIDQHRKEDKRQAALILTTDPPDPKLSLYDRVEEMIRRGSIAEQQGDTERRIRLLREAVAMAQTDNLALNNARVQLWVALLDAGNLAESIQLGHVRYQAARMQGSKGAEAGAAMALVRAYVKAGGIDQARDALRDAEAAYGELKGRPNIHRYYRHFYGFLMAASRGDLLQATGNFAAAELAYGEALAEHESEGPLRAEREAKSMFTNPEAVHRLAGENLVSRVATVQLLQGKVYEAEANARRYLRMTLDRTGLHSVTSARALMTLAEVLAQQGRSVDARYLLQQALESLDKAGVSPQSAILAEVRRALAGEYTMSGDCKSALTHYDKLAQAGSDAQAMNRGLARGDVRWGLALAQCSQGDAAVAMLRQVGTALAGSHGEGHYETAETQGALAMAYRALGQDSIAHDHFKKAVPILLADDLRLTRTLKATAQRRTWILESYIDLLADLHVRQPDPALAAEAFRLADATRGQTSQQAITASAARAAAGTPRLADLVRDEQDARRDINEAYAQLYQLMNLPPEQVPAGAVAGLQARIERQRSALAELGKTLARDFPKYAQLVAPVPAGVESVQAALRPGEVLVGILPMQRRTLVWAVPKQGAVQMAAQPVGEDALAQRVAKLRTAVDPGAVALGDIPEFDTGIAHALYADLLKPLRPAWEKAEVVVVAASGALGKLPMAALVTEPVTLVKTESLLFDRYRAVPWLGKTHAFAYVPSVTAFTSLRSQGAPSANRRAFAGFGDPIFAADAARPEAAVVATAATAPTAQTRSAPVLRAVVNSRQASAAGEFVALPPLPDTRGEILAIADALRADPRRDIFLGADANKRQLAAADLATRKVIAFATHGLVPGDLPGLSQPALALTPDRDASDRGLLTLEDVMKLKLDADWVILSACNTAASDDATDVAAGLGSGFFYAGARSILATHWPVESVSARELVSGVFGILSGTAMPRARALQASMNRMLDGSQKDSAGRRVFSYAHPIFWAPYALYGDGI